MSNRTHYGILEGSQSAIVGKATSPPLGIPNETPICYECSGILGFEASPVDREELLIMH